MNNGTVALLMEQQKIDILTYSTSKIYSSINSHSNIDIRYGKFSVNKNLFSKNNTLSKY